MRPECITQRAINGSPLRKVLAAADQIAGFTKCSDFKKADLCVHEPDKKSPYKIRTVTRRHPTIHLKNSPVVRPRNDEIDRQDLWNNIRFVEAPHLTDSFNLKRDEFMHELLLPESSDKLVFILSDASAPHTVSKIHDKFAAHLTVFFVKMDKSGIVDPDFSNRELMKLLAENSEISKQVNSVLDNLLSDAALLMKEGLRIENEGHTLEDVELRMNIGYRSIDEGKRGDLGVAPQSGPIGHMMLVAQPHNERNTEVLEPIDDNAVIKLIDPLSKIFELDSLIQSICSYVLTANKVHSNEILARNDGVRVNFENSISFGQMLEFLAKFFAISDKFHSLVVSYYELKYIKCASSSEVKNSYNSITDYASTFGIDPEAVDSLLLQLESVEPSFAQLIDKKMALERESNGENLVDDSQRRIYKRTKKLENRYIGYNTPERKQESEYKALNYQNKLRKKIELLTKAQLEGNLSEIRSLQESIATIQQRLIIHRISKQARLDPAVNYEISQSARLDPTVNYQSLNAIFPRTKLPITVSVGGIRQNPDGTTTVKSIDIYFSYSARGVIESLHGRNVIRDGAK